MAFSYSALNNYGKVSLPSNDNWGTNMNILRDPPKSIMTRRRDKVGETSSLTEMVDGSGDRVCEAINQYARGVNPFVSVSYSNNSNNGGQRSSGLTVRSGGGGGEAYLPYRIMNGGAFRPPALTQAQLMPLSRQPRAWTTAQTQPGFVDFSKKMRTCGTAEDTKEVRNSTLKVCARPTAVYKIEKPIEEPFEIKYVIQNPIKITKSSGVRTMDLTTQNVKKPVGGIDNQNLHAFGRTNLQDIKHIDNNNMETKRYLQDFHNAYGQTNLNENRHVDNNNMETERYLQEFHNAYGQTNLNENRHVDNNNMETDRYTQEHQNIPVVSKTSANIQFMSVDEVMDLSDIKTKDLKSVKYTAPMSGNEKTKYIHNDIVLNRRAPETNAITNLSDKTKYKKIESNNSIQLRRNVPHFNAVTNIGRKDRGTHDKSSRTYNLREKISPGGFGGKMTMPAKIQDRNLHNFDSQKTKLGKLAFEQMNIRYSH